MCRTTARGQRGDRRHRPHSPPGATKGIQLKEGRTGLFPDPNGFVVIEALACGCRSPDVLVVPRLLCKQTSVKMECACGAMIDSRIPNTNARLAFSLHV